MKIPATPSQVTDEWLSSIIEGNVTGLDWIGAGYGLSGHVARVSTESGTRALKLSPAAKSRREIAFYRHYSGDTPVLLPTFFGGGADENRGWILLDFIDGTRQGDVLEGTTSTQIGGLAASLARLHGRWWGTGDSAPRLLSADSSSWQNTPTPAPDADIDLCAAILDPGFRPGSKSSRIAFPRVASHPADRGSHSHQWRFPPRQRVVGSRRSALDPRLGRRHVWPAGDRRGTNALRVHDPGPVPETVRASTDELPPRVAQPRRPRDLR